MEDTLKRLLKAEQRAAEITQAAEQEAQAIVQAAMDQSRELRERFDSRVPRLRASHLEKADERAQQTVKEIERRYAERIAGLREAAERNEESALSAAFEYLLDRKS